MVGRHFEVPARELLSIGKKQKSPAKLRRLWQRTNPCSTSRENGPRGKGELEGGDLRKEGRGEGKSFDSDQNSPANPGLTAKKIFLSLRNNPPERGEKRKDRSRTGQTCWPFQDEVCDTSVTWAGRMRVETRTPEQKPEIGGGCWQSPC